MEEKAQVNMEYLLLIVGAVVIVTVVAIFIKSTASSITDAGQSTLTDNKVVPVD